MYRVKLDGSLFSWSYAGVVLEVHRLADWLHSRKVRRSFRAELEWLCPHPRKPGFAQRFVGFRVIQSALFLPLSLLQSFLFLLCSHKLDKFLFLTDPEFV